MSKISVGKDSGSYDGENFIVRLEKEWSSAQIWLGDFDASNYPYIRIEYESVASETNLSFRLHCRYSDNTSSYQLCERKRKVQYCSIERGKRTSVKSVFVQAMKDVPMSVRIKSICFTQNKILTPAVVDYDGHAAFGEVSSFELVDRMGIGWNLANTLEAHSFSWQENPRLSGMDSEFLWESTETTREILEFAYSKGYKSIRIPVTWYNHIIDESYTIDPDWMLRVKEIVDTALDIGYYVILNEHHSVHGGHGNEYLVQEDGSRKYSSRAMGKPLRRGKDILSAVTRVTLPSPRDFCRRCGRRLPGPLTQAMMSVLCLRP